MFFCFEQAVADTLVDEAPLIIRRILKTQRMVPPELDDPVADMPVEEKPADMPRKILKLWQTNLFA